MQTPIIETEKAPDRESPFRFLDLAAELRTRILEIYAQDSGCVLVKNSGHDDSDNGTLTSKDSISLVSKQVRKEYLGTLYQYAQLTRALVVDFDFRRAIAFFQSLSAAERRALPKKHWNTNSLADHQATDHDDSIEASNARTANGADAGASSSPAFSTPSQDANGRYGPQSHAALSQLAPRMFRMMLEFAPDYDPRPYTQILDWLNCFASDGPIASDVKITYLCYRYQVFRNWADSDDLDDLPITAVQRDAASTMVRFLNKFGLRQLDRDLPSLLEDLDSDVDSD